jgi:hypothetical protein
VERLLERVRGVPLQLEVIVVDDGSSTVRARLLPELEERGDSSTFSSCIR